MGALAAKVRAKYPGVYDDLSDADLEQKILAKYPQYGDIAEPATQPKPVTPAPTEPSAPAPGALEQMLGVQTGFAKELPRLALQAANLPRDIISGATSLITDQMGPEAQRADILKNEAEYKARQMVEAPFRRGASENLGEKAGRLVAKVAPSAALGVATSGASIPIQSAIMGPSSAAQTLGEGGSLRDAAISGAIGAVAPAVAPLVAKAMSGPANALRNLAIKQYQRALGATKDATKAEAVRITPELLDRGVVGTAKGLASKAEQNVSEVGRQIQSAYKEATKTGTKVSGTQLADALENLKTPFKEIGQSGKEVVLNPKAVGAIDEMQGILRELGDTSPSAIWKFRKTVDDIVSASNGFTRELPGGTAKAIQKQVRGILQDELNKAVPSVEALNAEFRLWKGLQDVIGATIKRQTSQERNLIPAVLGGGLGGGVAASGNLSAAGATAAGVAALTQLVRSPLYRTVSAGTKNAIAEILSGGSEALKTDAGRNAMMLLALYGGAASREPAQPARR